MQSQMWSVRYGIAEEKIRDAAAFISLTHHDSAFDTLMRISKTADT